MRPELAMSGGALPLSMPPPHDSALMASAIELEGAFISEMLKSAGFGAARDAFGGGQGEEQFASFLRERQARSIAEAGGFGLAEAIYRSMVARQDGV